MTLYYILLLLLSLDLSIVLTIDNKICKSIDYDLNNINNIGTSNITGIIKTIQYNSTITKYNNDNGTTTINTISINNNDYTLLCPYNYDNCDLLDWNGCEVNLNNDNNNCGKCDNNCNDINKQYPHTQLSTCYLGVCTISKCINNYGNCDNINSNGCETYLNTIYTCGNCLNDCTKLPNVLAIGCNLTISNCDILSCLNGYIDLDNNPNNGCEVDYLSDINYCGDNGIKCSSSSEICDNGLCTYSRPLELDVITCTAPLQPCTIQVINPVTGQPKPTTICVDHDNNINHCNDCNNACNPVNNARVSCNNGKCEYTCLPEYYDVNGLKSDRCEVDSRFDNSNCGAINVKCDTNRFYCKYGSCLPLPQANNNNNCPVGFSLCSVNDIYCTSLMNNNMNCGVCNLTCNTNYEYCVRGVCTRIIINTDDIKSNISSSSSTGGNIVNTFTGDTIVIDISSSGSSGINNNNGPGCLNPNNPCASIWPQATASCDTTTGDCYMGSCIQGFDNCNALTYDGCEISLLNSPENCGKCGVYCATGVCYRGLAYHIII